MLFLLSELARMVVYMLVYASTEYIGGIFRVYIFSRFMNEIFMICFVLHVGVLLVFFCRSSSSQCSECGTRIAVLFVLV